jgi:hypothetical protein
MSQRFLQLGVIVEGGYVYKGMFGKGARLGPLAGAQAELGDPTRHRRVGAAVGGTIALGAVLGPLPLLAGLSKKSKALAFVVFPTGTVHERKLDGNTAIRGAQSEVIRFNALAAAEAGRPPATDL